MTELKNEIRKGTVKTQELFPDFQPQLKTAMIYIYTAMEGKLNIISDMTPSLYYFPKESHPVPITLESFLKYGPNLDIVTALYREARGKEIVIMDEAGRVHSTMSGLNATIGLEIEPKMVDMDVLTEIKRIEGIRREILDILSAGHYNAKEAHQCAVPTSVRGKKRAKQGFKYVGDPIEAKRKIEQSKLTISQPKSKKESTPDSILFTQRSFIQLIEMIDQTLRLMRALSEHKQLPKGCEVWQLIEDKKDAELTEQEKHDWRLNTYDRVIFVKSHQLYMADVFMVDKEDKDTTYIGTHIALCKSRGKKAWNLLYVASTGLKAAGNVEQLTEFRKFMTIAKEHVKKKDPIKRNDEKADSKKGNSD